MIPNFLLVLRRSGTNFNISGFFITVKILIFKDLYMSILSTILYILNNNKKMLWMDWNFRQCFFIYSFIYTHDLQQRIFRNSC